MRSALGIGGIVAAVVVTGCSGRTTDPGPTPNSSSAKTSSAAGYPEYRTSFTLPLMRTYPVSLFGELTETSTTATTCAFEWNTGHPVDFHGSAVATVGQTVTLHAFRDARLTLSSVTSQGCQFEEFLPASNP